MPKVVALPFEPAAPPLPLLPPPPPAPPTTMRTLMDLQPTGVVYVPEPEVRTVRVQEDGTFPALIFARATDCAAAAIVCEALYDTPCRLVMAVSALVTSLRLFALDRSPTPGWPARLRFQLANVPVPTTLSTVMVSVLPA